MIDIFNTTTLYCQHHGDGNPSIEMPLPGVQPTERISKPDDRKLREIGITTIRQSGKESHARNPLNLYTLRVIGKNKVFEIHCNEGCSMADVLHHLAKKYYGDDIVFVVGSLNPDDDYNVIHNELVTVRPGRFHVSSLPTNAYQKELVAVKIRNRGRCLFWVSAYS